MSTQYDLHHNLLDLRLVQTGWNSEPILIFRLPSFIGSSHFVEIFRFPSYSCLEKLEKIIVKLQVLGLRLGVDFTFTLDNNDNNDNNDKDNDNNNPHLNFFKGTVLGVKEQGLGIRDKA